ncbi:MAG: hypothetical protein ACT4PE_18155 [Candidatus Eiseniibacteriota bacterium]
MKPTKLLEVANASGFVFQMAVAECVTAGSPVHGWTLVATEHPWMHDEAGSSGFVDLVVGRGLLRLVVECKRSKDANWVFLRPTEGALDSPLRVHWIDFRPGDTPLCGWGEVELRPSAVLSGFCAVRGSAQSHAPMLEGIARPLVDATEAIAQHELVRLAGKDHPEWIAYVPVLVTNATLHMCALSPAEVSLATGEIDVTRFDETGSLEEVQWAHFRKALSARRASVPTPGTLEDLNRSLARSVVIVGATHLDAFLRECNVRQCENRLFPWDRERSRWKQQRERASA